MHDLTEYPELIADKQTQLLAVTTQIEEATSLLTDLISRIDLEIAFDDSLKNESQRKGKKIELCSENQDVKNLESRIKTLEFQKAKSKIELEKYLNQFSILKLIRREDIAFFEEARIDNF